MHLKNFNTQEHADFIFPRRIYFPTQNVKSANISR